MNEVKTTLKRMAVYYLLLALNIIPCANLIPDSFPTRNISAVYLLTLCVCLVMYYSHRVVRAGALSFFVKSLSWLSLLLILLRGIKYSAFAEVEPLARHTWYLYYVPILLLPLFLFGISLLVSPKNNTRIPKGWYSALAVSVILIAFVLTNDLHQLVFGFQPGFANWDNEYSYGWLFYVIIIWQYALYLSAIIILVVKCRIGSSRKSVWVFLIPVSLGAAMNLLLMTDRMPRINGAHIIEFPEALIFTVAALLECCMQLGLIPTNTDYGKLFRNFSIRAQITDKTGNAVYSSGAATELSEEQFNLPNNSRIGEHTVLRKMKIPGGYGFWQDDLTELDTLNEELADAKENLAQEGELIRLRNELKEKETEIEQRTLVYDSIAERTQKQSQAISRFAQAARTSDYISVKEEYRKRITLLGAYIKRFANLMLLSQESNQIQTGELGLSVSEVLRYLNFCSIPGELFNSADCTVTADAALAVFEAFGALLESNYSCLKGAFVNISDTDEKVSFKLTMENISEYLPNEMLSRLSAVGVSAEKTKEDNDTFICFTLPKGGEAV